MNQVSYDLSKRLKVLDEQYKNMDSTRYSVVQPPVDFVKTRKDKKTISPDSLLLIFLRSLIV